jgi:hypothetical protein
MRFVLISAMVMIASPAVGAETWLQCDWSTSTQSFAFKCSASHESKDSKSRSVVFKYDAKANKFYEYNSKAAKATSGSGLGDRGARADHVQLSAGFRSRSSSASTAQDVAGFSNASS